MSECKTPPNWLDRLLYDLNSNEPVYKGISVYNVKNLCHDARLARELERQVSMETECIERIRNKCYELEAQAEKNKAEIARLHAWLPLIEDARATNRRHDGELYSNEKCHCPICVIVRANNGGTEEKP